jgi:serine/threonine-protein kinase
MQPVDGTIGILATVSFGGSRSFLSRLLWSPTGAAALADEHVFLQKRVRLYLQILLAFFGTFVFFGLAKMLALSLAGQAEWARAAGHGSLILLALTLALAFAWRYLGGERRPIILLHLIESAGTVLGSAVLASIVHLVPYDVPVPTELGLVLVMVLALVIRAAVVPSTSVRTLAVGLLATLALTVALWRWGAAVDSQDDPFAHYLWAVSAAWGVVFTIATAIVSRVIYGLQKTVREAMQLGNYTLEEKLGEGGMGIVYRARHAMLRRGTAVKLLPPEKAGEQAVARFEREVQLTARLTHPNTVTVFDYGRTPEGIFYYAMELLDGASLEDVVALDGAQPPERVIHILQQVAGALSEAHAIGLIHRDVKPANIFLCEQGGELDVPKVLDFGLVKEVNEGGGVGLTQADAITGTPLYMSPESIRAPGRMDGRSDLYALGAVGYYLLAGDHVFKGDTLVEVCGHHLHTTPQAPSERLGSTVPEDLEVLLLECLEKEPSKRPETAAALRRRLQRCRASGEWDGERARRWWRDNSAGLQERRATRAEPGPGDPSAGGPPPGSLMSVDTRTRWP